MFSWCCVLRVVLFGYLYSSEKWISVCDIEFIRVIQYNKILSNFATKVDFGCYKLKSFE
jgi:hypothetical protein